MVPQKTRVSKKIWAAPFEATHYYVLIRLILHIHSTIYLDNLTRYIT